MSNSTNPQLSKIFKIKFQSSKHIVNIGEVDVLILVHIHFLDIYNTSLSHVYLSDFSTEMLQWRLYDIQPHYVSNLWFLKMKKSKPNYRHQSCHQINWKNKQTNNKTNKPQKRNLPPRLCPFSRTLLLSKSFQKKINTSDTVLGESSLVRCPTLIKEQKCKL